MRQNDSWADAKALRQFFDHLSDAVLLFDRNARVTFANTAALSVLPCEIGMPLGQLRGLLGDIALRWVQQRVSASVDIDPPTLATTLHDGRPARLVWQVLDATLSALSLQLIVPARGADTAAAPLSTELSEPGVAELVRVFWKSPFPATLQDSAYRIVDVNAAYLEFSGYPRETLIGIDPLQLQPEEDRDTNRAARDEFAAALSRADVPPLIERRIIDARGRERWFRAARSALIDDAGQHLYLVVLQDTTAEHAARDSADRSVRELDSWFDLSPLGMVLFDEAGLVVRTNPAFEALVGEVPAVLAEASLGLQQLLVWHDGAPAPELRATRRAVVVQGWLPQPDGSQRRLRSNVRCYTTPSGQQRYMAVVEDRSIEEERDLAQMQIGALIDTAGVGIATFQESSGWVRQRHAPAGEAASSASASSAALQSISRDIVVPDSLPEYERLQHALRHAQRAEVRYAVRHPELGLRWLFTRVEPATLASGQRTTSVVTLDVTEQKTQALELEILARDRELMFSLSEVGIAFVRDGRLQRANDALAQLSGYSAAEISGLPIEQLFPDSQDDPRRAARERNTLRQFGRWVGERQLKRRDGQLLWMQVGERLVTEGDPAGGIIASYVNVDDRHRAEQAVALQADRTRAILDSVLVGIVTVGPGGIEWMNRSARRMFGGDLPSSSASRSAPSPRPSRCIRFAGPSTSTRSPRARPTPSSAASRRATGASSGSSATR